MFNNVKKTTKSRRMSRTLSLSGIQIYQPHAALNASDIDEIYAKRCELSKKEIGAFLNGRYHLKGETIDIMFTLFDTDSSESIDKNEFALMIADLNQFFETYDANEIDFYESTDSTIFQQMAFMYCCCLCTLGLSCVTARKTIETQVQDRAHRTSSSVNRMNKELLEFTKAKRHPTSTNVQGPVYSPVAQTLGSSSVAEDVTFTRV